MVREAGCGGAACGVRWGRPTNLDARGGLLIFSKKRGYTKKHNKEDTAKKKKKPRALRPKGLLGRAALRFGPSGRRGVPCRNCGCA